jgi:hypothetical protein
MPILRSDCDKMEYKGDSQTIQAVKRVRQDDVDSTDQADTPTSVEALEDDERKAALNRGLDKTSSQDHSASSVPDRTMPETLQKDTVDKSAADLPQQSQEVKQPAGQLPTLTQYVSALSTHTYTHSTTNPPTYY